MGTRLGSPMSVVPPSCGSMAACAASQPSSAMVRHDTSLDAAAAPPDRVAASTPPGHSDGRGAGAGGVAGGVGAPGSGGQAPGRLGAAASARNQADSSSLKIGSSTVMSLAN